MTESDMNAVTMEFDPLLGILANVTSICNSMSLDFNNSLMTATTLSKAEMIERLTILHRVKDIGPRLAELATTLILLSEVDVDNAATIDSLDKDNLGKNKSTDGKRKALYQLLLAVVEMVEYFQLSSPNGVTNQGKQVDHHVYNCDVIDDILSKTS